MPDPMPPIDYMGPQGGALAMAFAAGCVSTATAFVAAGAALWKWFFNPRLDELKAQLKDEREEFHKQIQMERDQCERQISQLRDRIIQLETILTQHGSPSLRQAIQAAMSEARITADADRTE
ncbi:hypothetical protein [Sphingomonas sp.]|uniref:hypothetical protein n=1 Tax=Sphingomonas sp. TaxID=28214 RepID=UPI0035A9797B